MYKLTATILLCFFITAALNAQQKPISKSVVETILKEIKDFQTKETKRDSIAGHPLGSNKEEDFLNHYNQR